MSIISIQKILKFGFEEEILIIKVHCLQVTQFSELKSTENTDGLLDHLPLVFSLMYE